LSYIFYALFIAQWIIWIHLRLGGSGVVIQNVLIVYTQNYNVINSKDLVQHNCYSYKVIKYIYLYFIE